MPLYIRDSRVDELAAKFMKISGSKSKTEAVRNALQAQIDAARSKMSVIDRLKPAQALARSIGERDKDFDMKKFTDEMWGDI